MSVNKPDTYTIYMYIYEIGNQNLWRLNTLLRNSQMIKVKVARLKSNRTALGSNLPKAYIMPNANRMLKKADIL